MVAGNLAPRTPPRAQKRNGRGRGGSSDRTRSNSSRRGSRSAMSSALSTPVANRSITNAGSSPRIRGYNVVRLPEHPDRISISEVSPTRPNQVIHARVENMTDVKTSATGRPNFSCMLADPTGDIKMTFWSAEARRWSALLKVGGCFEFSGFRVVPNNGLNNYSGHSYEAISRRFAYIGSKDSETLNSMAIRVYIRPDRNFFELYALNNAIVNRPSGNTSFVNYDIEGFVFKVREGFFNNGGEDVPKLESFMTDGRIVIMVTVINERMSEFKSLFDKQVYSDLLQGFSPIDEQNASGLYVTMRGLQPKFFRGCFLQLNKNEGEMFKTSDFNEDLNASLPIYPGRLTNVSETYLDVDSNEADRISIFQLLERTIPGTYLVTGILSFEITPDFFYEGVPEEFTTGGARAVTMTLDGNFLCSATGEIYEYSEFYYRLPVTLSDCSIAGSTIKATLFNNSGRKLFGKSAEELSNLYESDFPAFNLEFSGKNNVKIVALIGMDKDTFNIGTRKTDFVYSINDISLLQ